MFGIGTAPASPAIGPPRGWPESSAAALRTALTWTDEDRPCGPRCTIATSASSGSPKILVAVASACRAGAFGGTRLATPLAGASAGR